MAASGTCSVFSIMSMYRSRSTGRQGMNPKPQFPTTTVVFPCQPELVQ